MTIPKETLEELELEIGSTEEDTVPVVLDVLQSLINSARELKRLRRMRVTAADGKLAFVNSLVRGNLGDLTLGDAIDATHVVHQNQPQAPSEPVSGAETAQDRVAAVSEACRRIGESTEPIDDPYNVRVVRKQDDALDAFTAAGTEAWKEVPDHVAWVREQRGDHVVGANTKVGDGLPEPEQVSGPETVELARRLEQLRKDHNKAVDEAIGLSLQHHKKALKRVTV